MIDLLCCLFTRTFKLGKKKEKERIDLNRRLPLLLTTTTVSGQFRMDAPRLSSVYCAISSTRTFVQPGFFFPFFLVLLSFQKEQRNFSFFFFYFVLVFYRGGGKRGGGDHRMFPGETQPERPACLTILVSPYYWIEIESFVAAKNHFDQDQRIISNISGFIHLEVWKLYVSFFKSMYSQSYY